MRWTQALLCFGLAALLTFQVEQSSAATLRSAVASSEVDEALSVELVSDEHDLGDLVKDLAEKAKERLQKLREEIRSAIEKIKQQGVGAVAKDVAERIKLRLSQIREAAKKLAEALGETELGKAAKQIAKQAEEAIAKIREGLKGKPTEPPKPAQPAPPTNIEDEVTLGRWVRPEYKLNLLNRRVEYEISNAQNLTDSAQSKKLAEEIVACLTEYRKTGNELARRYERNPRRVGLDKVARDIAQKADEAIAKINEKFNLKPASSVGEEEEELLASELQKLIQERIEKMREALGKEVDKIANLPKILVDLVRARIQKIRDAAKKIAAKLGETELGTAAKKLVTDADAALNKIKDKIRGKPAEPTPSPNNEDEELLITWATPEGRLRNLAKFLENDISAANKLDDNKESIRKAKKIVTRLTGMRNVANKFVDANKDKPRADGLDKFAKEMAKRADETIAKLKEKISGKPAKLAGEEEEELLAVGGEEYSQGPSKSFLEDLQEDVRAAVAQLPGRSKEELLSVRKFFKFISDNAKNIGDRGEEVNNAAKNLIKEADEAIRKVDEALKAMGEKANSR